MQNCVVCKGQWASSGFNHPENKICVACTAIHVYHTCKSFKCEKHDDCEVLRCFQCINRPALKCIREGTRFFDLFCCWAKECPKPRMIINTRF